MISVIVPTFERADSLRLCLTALRAQEFTDFEIIVVDDGSDDFCVAKEYNTRYIWHPHNGFGLSRSRNEGARLAKGELLHFIDSDIMLAPNALKEAWRMYQENKDRAIGGYYKYLKGMEITPLDVVERWDDIWNMRLPEKSVFQQFVPIGKDVREAQNKVDKTGESPFDSHEKVLWGPFALLGGNMIIPRHIFDQTGGFDEHFVVYGGEDAEMSLAIISRGYGISYSRNIAGCHIAHPKSSDATGEQELEHRKYIAAKYPYFLHQDGTPRTEVWGLPVQRRNYESQ